MVSRTLSVNMSKELFITIIMTVMFNVVLASSYLLVL